MAQTPIIHVAPNTATKEDLRRVFDQQRAHAPTVAHSSAKERKAKLRKLIRYIKSHEEEITSALQKDFHKHPFETIITELVLTVQEAKHTIRNLSKWMRPHRVGTPIVLLGSSGYVQYQPKGNVLIMAPWNYPFNLVVGPLISAIAAGNVVIVKPSEMTPSVSAVIKKMVEELFDENEVAVFEGNHEIAQGLLELPFNHIFFTGSPGVGKIVMAAAAKHLASVTLELGGKSPAVIDETAPIKSTAEKIAWGKCINNGQTCIAPDYVLVHESKQEAFIKEFGKAVHAMYGEDIKSSESYCRIVNARHFQRINELIQDAIEKGANIALGGKTDPSEDFIEPTILTDLTAEMSIMEEEIFGPVLPVIAWSNMDDMLKIINSRPKPLALYILSKSKKNIDYILYNTRSGDVTVNDTMLHFSHPDLPFGGANISGIGKSGGHSGFKAFSHERSVLRQVFGTLKPLYPPYKPIVGKIARFLKKIV
jgi:aldehyde dehydrogenase (NAD+)